MNDEAKLGDGQGGKCPSGDASDCSEADSSETEAGAVAESTSVERPYEDDCLERDTECEGASQKGDHGGSEGGGVAVSAPVGVDEPSQGDDPDNVAKHG